MLTSDSRDLESRPGQAGTPASLHALIHSPERLAAVHRSGLLDSPPEDSFDSLTDLATRLLKVSASFISIVDGKRDFYKSQAGFGAPLCDTRQVEGRTFCHFTLDRRDALVIDDTHSDPVWKSVATVESLGVRAYVGVPLRIDGQNIGSFCVIDMQARLWRPDEIEIVVQLARSAERELRLRAALGVAEASLQNANAMVQAKEKLIATVAHDLLTPLQVLQLSTRVLQKNTNGEHQTLVTRMVTSVGMIRAMADDLLAASRMPAASLGGRQAMPASALAADAMDMMKPIADRSKINLTKDFQSDGLLSIDYRQMLRVMANLIGNSLKYSPEGSTVTIGGRRDGRTFVLSVTDNGKGMEAGEQAHAFDHGWQGGEGMKRGDGAGLGLSIVKSLVVQQGGTVSLTSTIGKGTSVAMSLPVASSPSE